MTPEPRRRTTLADVAQLAEVDKALVSKVINGDPRLRIKADTRQRIQDAIAALNYRPSRLARNLRLSRSSTIGLVVPSITNPVWAELMSGIEQEAETAGLTLMAASEATSAGDTKPSAKYLDLLEEKSLDALLVAAPIDDATAQNLPAEKLILLNQAAPTFSGRRIIFDDHHAVELALDHLIGLGHTRIAHLAGPNTLDATRRREQAYRSTMHQHSFAAQSLSADVLSPATGASLLLQLLDHTPRPTAVLVSNVIAAAGALRAAIGAGLHVPRDLSVMCIHDLELCSVLSPALTAVRLPIRELGRAAVHEAVNGTPRDELIVLSTGIEVITRESTGTPPD